MSNPTIKFPVRLAAALACLTIVSLAHSQTPAAPLPSASSQSTAEVTGTVVDDQDIPVSGATVTLLPFGKVGERTATTTTASDGTFTFTSQLPDVYRLEVITKGFSLYSSGEFTLHAGTPFALPKIVLKTSTTTNVTVVASEDQVALAEIHMQEQQRVFGVFQNFYTSYIWDAAPMPAKQKFRLAFRALVDPPQFFIVAGLAGAEQYNGTYPGYGPGIEGYGKRYGAALADASTARIIGSGILPVVFHQDPRYFYQGSGSIPSRTLHAISFTFVARGDNGHNQPNYSHLLGSLSAAGIANLYHPETSRGLGDTFQTFGITTFGNIVGNVFREFVLRHLETIPTFANGKQKSSSTTKSSPTATP